RVVQMRPGQCAQVGATGQYERVDVVPGGNGADRDDGDAEGVADPVGERRLVRAAEVGAFVGDDLSGGDVDRIGAVFGEGRRDGEGVVGGGAAVGPVGGRDPDRHGPVGRPRFAHRVEDLQGETQPAGQGTSVGVRTLVRQWGKEAGQQISVGAVEFEEVES